MRRSTQKWLTRTATSSRSLRYTPMFVPLGAGLEDHGPRGDDEERQDEPGSARPPAQVSRRLVALPTCARALGRDRGSALERGAECEGDEEQAERERHPELVEA